MYSQFMMHGQKNIKLIKYMLICNIILTVSNSKLCFAKTRK